MPYVKLMHGRDLLGTQALERDVTHIGRDAKADLRVQDPLVSRFHARIVRTAKGHVVEDQGAPNGLFVNGQRVTVRELRNGDEVALGAHTLRYESEDSLADLLEPDLDEADADGAAAGARDTTEYVPLEDIKRLREHAEAMRKAFVSPLDDPDTVLPIDAGLELGPAEYLLARVPGGLLVPPVVAVIERKENDVIVRAISPYAKLRVNGNAVESAVLVDRDELEVRGRAFVFRDTA
jgi:predicted component of type VI protein secretion system